MDNDDIIIEDDFEEELDTNLAEAFKKLKEAGIDIAKVSVALARAKSKEKIHDTVEGVKSSINNSAKRFGISLKENASKYSESREEVENIMNEYEESLEKIEEEYDRHFERIQILKEEKLGEKDETLAQIHQTKKDKQEFLRNNKPEFKKQSKELAKELSKSKRAAAKAIRKGDFKTAESLIEDCKSLETKITELEIDYNDELTMFDGKIDELQEDYKSLKDEIKELDEYEKDLEDDFEKECEFAVDEKEQSLAEVKNNKLFDRIKGFLSKSILTKSGAMKKFKNETLIPTGKKVKDFANSVPDRLTTLKENFTNRLNNIVNNGKEKFEQVKETILEKGNDIKEFAVDAKDTVVATAYGAKEFAKEKAGQAKDFVIDSKDTIIDKATDVRDVTIGTVFAAFEFAKEKGIGIKESLEGAYTSGVQKVSETKGKLNQSAISLLENTAIKLQERAEQMRESQSKGSVKKDDIESYGLY